MPLVLGVASLATATRVEIRDADDGRLVAEGTAPHPGVDAAAPAPEQTVAAWWDGLVDAIGAAGRRTDVAGLAVAGQRGAVVLVDAIGTPIGPASVAGDRRAAGIAAELTERLGADRLARATGHCPGPDSPLARLVWLVARQPDLVDRVAGVLGAADVLTARLTGRTDRWVTDRAGASTTGWWDPSAERWRVDLLTRVAQPAPAEGWATVLPTVLQPAEPADWVSANIHTVAGLRGRPLVAAGTTDLAARALAAAVGPGSAAALLDDVEPVVVAGTATPVADPRGRVVGLADATGHHLPTLPIGAVAPMLDGVARLLGTDAAGLATRAAGFARRAGWRPPGIVVLPRSDGGVGPARSGAVLGVDDAAGPGELAWAALLGAAAEVLDALAALDGVGGGEPDGGRVVLAGPVARRAGMAAAIAELAGREVVVTRHGGAATGACVQAAAALGDANPLDIARAWGLHAGDVVEPAGGLDAAAYLGAHAQAREHLDGAARS